MPIPTNIIRLLPIFTHLGSFSLLILINRTLLLHIYTLKPILKSYWALLAII